MRDVTDIPTSIDKGVLFPYLYINKAGAYVKGETHPFMLYFFRLFECGSLAYGGCNELQFGRADIR